MRFQTFFIIILSVLLAVFTAINWSAFLALSTLSLIFTTIQAPLGIVMLGAILFLGALFLLYMFTTQTRSLLESHRLNKQLESQRALADNAENSRFTELRHYLQAELQRLQTYYDDKHSSMTDKLEILQKEIHRRGEITENAVAAQLGELDDRLQRQGRSAE